ncbi:hypothetical protein [Streptomyces sp. Ag109_O5-10]|nr:hypothetical protein [Streptomyces sp. Ag109_O5-10]
MLGEGDPADAVRVLVGAADEAGGADNVSVVVADAVPPAHPPVSVG